MAIDYGKYGKHGHPINGTRVYRRQFGNFNIPGIEAVSWVIVDDTNGTYVAVNTYNGKAGYKFDISEQRYLINASSEKKWLKEYARVEVDECPLTPKSIMN